MLECYAVKQTRKTAPAASATQTLKHSNNQAFFSAAEMKKN
jgi:hypothetical protein